MEFFWPLLLLEKEEGGKRICFRVGRVCRKKGKKNEMK
jgi:hypothetical protein